MRKKYYPLLWRYPMNYLAIDTSTHLATVALSVGNHILEESHEALRQHAQLILPTVDSLLANAGIRINQLDGIIFGRGPGSFTGLRIACSMAKALAYAHDLPLYPVSSLAAIAFQEAKQDLAVLAVMDARMNQVYWGFYPSNNNHVLEQVSDASAIQIPEDASILIAGVGFEEYWLQFPVWIQNASICKKTVYPSAATMINMVQAGLISPVTAAQAAPQYIRNQVTHGASHG